MIAVEAYDWHRDLIADRFDLYDKRVGPRIMHGSTVLAADYVAAMRTISDCRRRYDDALADADGIVTPTVPVLPPRVVEVESLEAYLAMNTDVLRLTEFANRLDLPSITMPGGVGPGNPDDRSPVGLMLTGKRGEDAGLLDLAVLVERCICSTD